MGNVERYWNVTVCLVGSITKHHALVTGSLLFFYLAADTLIDVLTLLMDGREDAA